MNSLRLCLVPRKFEETLRERKQRGKVEGKQMWKKIKNKF